MDLRAIKTKAAEFSKSYATAVALGHTDPKATTTNIAEAIFRHYNQETFVSFNHGTVAQFNGAELGVPIVQSHMDRFVQHGLGLDIRLDRYRIEATSPSNALCFLTWSVHPPTERGLESWSWENVYSFRLLPGQENGCWEFALSDNEVAGLLQHVPEFFSSAS